MECGANVFKMSKGAVFLCAFGKNGRSAALFPVLLNDMPARIRG